MKQVVAALFIVLSIPVFLFGWGFLGSAMKLWFGQPFCAGSCQDYSVYAGMWMGIVLLILVPSVAVLLKKDSQGGWLVLPLLLLLLVAIAIPSNVPPGGRARNSGRASARRMQGAAESLKAWAAEHRQLPGDDKELQAALELKPAYEEIPTYSRYQRGERSLPYRFVLVAGARGPHRPQPAGDQPAILYCAISPDRQKFWLTATALPDDVSKDVVMLESEGELVTVNGELPPMPPESVPAPGKKSGKK